MKVDIIQTGSLGNATVLTDSANNQLLIDCGVKYEAIVPHIGSVYRLSLLITHKHGDHTASLQHFSFLGIPSCVPAEVCAELPFGSQIAEHAQQIQLGEAWSVLPVKVPHGDCECFAYIIANKTEKKKIFWATDLQKLPPIADTQGWDLIAVECNYDENLAIEAAANGTLQNTGFRNHQSLQALKGWLLCRQNKPNRLCALHLSNSGLMPIELLKVELSPLCGQLIIGKKNTVFTI